MLSNSADVIHKSIRTTNISSSYLAHITLITTVWPWVWSIYICFVDILHRFRESKPINSAPNCALAIGLKHREICIGLFVDLNIGPLIHMSDALYWMWPSKSEHWLLSQIAKSMGPTWGPPGSCRPQMGPMLAPWTLLSGVVCMVFCELI